MAKCKREVTRKEAPVREDLAERFVESLGAIMRMRGSIFRKAMGEHGVTGPQFFLMKMVGAHGELSVTQVSDMMMVAAPTASRMIDGLCEKGMLSRRKDPGNRRVTLVSLTSEGERIMRRLWDQQKYEFMRLTSDEDAEKLAGLVDFLEELAGRLSRAPAGDKG
ncbi:MAG: MarR family transcriptional regulator [Actinobacteria bacterium]|nr:MarR family transcriptional regulator [Actinomycetota bacterium]